MNHETLSSRLTAVIDRLPAGGITVGEIRDLFGADAAMVLTIFLTLVFIVPISIPGVSTVFGAAILLLSISRVTRREIWLPRSFAGRAVPADRLRAALRAGVRWLQRVERISRADRMSSITSAGLAGRVNDGGLVLGASLLMAPFGMIPFSNTAPALALLLLAFGSLQRDGFCILLGHAVNVLAIAYFAVLLAGGGIILQKALQSVFG